MSSGAATIGRSVTSQDIATALNGIVGGTTVTQVRDDIYLIDVVGRARESERQSIETLRDLQLPGASGNSVPLAAVANFRYEMEQPVVWRRSRLPTITVKAAINGTAQPSTVSAQLEKDVATFGADLPDGYRIEIGGTIEESAKSQAPIAAVVPLMLFTMATILMIQLQSFSRLFLVFAVAPLALIGVVAALLPSGARLGFVAILGVLALIGILIRNSVILVVQIEDLRKEGVAADGEWRRRCSDDAERRRGGAGLIPAPPVQADGGLRSSRARRTRDWRNRCRFSGCACHR